MKKHVWFSATQSKIDLETFVFEWLFSLNASSSFFSKDSTGFSITNFQKNLLLPFRGERDVPVIHKKIIFRQATHATTKNFGIQFLPSKGVAFPPYLIDFPSHSTAMCHYVYQVIFFVFFENVTFVPRNTYCTIHWRTKLYSTVHGWRIKFSCKCCCCRKVTCALHIWIFSDQKPPFKSVFFRCYLFIGQTDDKAEKQAELYGPSVRIDIIIKTRLYFLLQKDTFFPPQKYSESHLLRSSFLPLRLSLSLPLSPSSVLSIS